MHHFVRKPHEYKRNVSPLSAYQRDVASYIVKHTGTTLEKAAEFVRRKTDADTGTNIHVPQVRVLVRAKNGDRKMQLMRFDGLLNDVVSRNRIMAPTLTVYEDPAVEKSMLGEYLGDNLQRRKTAKGEMFVAGMAGDLVLKAIKNAEQNTLKIKNNSMSGAHSSPYTILFNKSSHSTLTSTCRTATSLGNANNEKFLCGNRHYYNPTIVRNNIISICNLTDLDAVANVVAKYGLVEPSVDQCVDIIRRSTDPYWRDDVAMNALRADLAVLSPTERAAFAYVGDFYHTAELNEQFARTFIGDMAFKATEPHQPAEERRKIVKGLDDNTKAFVSIVCAQECNGRQLKDVPDDSEELGIIAATAVKVIAALDARYEFIRAFWVTDNMPSSVYYLPSIIRRGAITSDTDSTIFTVQHWPKWYRGTLDFTPESIAIANTLVYFSAETIRHILALYSANLGASVEEIHRLSMKNEYYFPTYVLTSRAKHYFAYIAAQEGNVYKELDIEIKGVALRSSNVPPAINKQAHNLMRFIMDEVMASRLVPLSRILRAVGKIEEGISNAIKAGGFELLPSMTIKSKDSYANPASSPYMHYDMWEAVFAPKYGQAPQLPYVGIKVNVVADNRTRFREWIAGMEDRAVASRMEAWAAANDKKDMGVLMLPAEILAMKGLPEEVIPAANIRGLISNTMTPFYLLLESIGYYVRNKHNTRLVSDEKWLLVDDWPHPELDLLNY